VARVIYEGDDFKRMTRADMTAMQKLVDSGKTGIQQVEFRGGKIRVEIKKRVMDNAIVVKRFRAM
jgi:hypothetical protein